MGGGDSTAQPWQVRALGIVGWDFLLVGQGLSGERGGERPLHNVGIPSASPRASTRGSLVDGESLRASPVVESVALGPGNAPEAPKRREN